MSLVSSLGNNSYLWNCHSVVIWLSKELYDKLNWPLKDWIASEFIDFTNTGELFMQRLAKLW